MLLADTDQIFAKQISSFGENPRATTSKNDGLYIHYFGLTLKICDNL